LDEAAFQKRVSDVAAHLRAGIEELLLAACGPAPRPMDLVRSLEIDKSLAGKLLRAVRAKDPFETLQVAPAPPGLRKLLAAARAKHVQPQTCEAFSHAIRHYDEMLDGIPNGRLGLEALLSSRLPEAAARGAHNAKQSVFRSMSFLLGYEADAAVNSLIVHPSQSGDRCDVVHLGGKFGLRRLRGREPLIVFGFSWDPLSQGADAHRIETLDGQAWAESAGAYVLAEFSSAPLAPLRILRNARMMMFALEPRFESVIEECSIVFAQVSRNDWARYRSEQRRFEWQNLIPRIPCRVLLADVIMHEDICPREGERIIVRAHGIAPVGQLADRDIDALDPNDLGLDRGVFPCQEHALRTGEIPRYPAIVARAFERMQWDATRFRVHRLRVKYPVPMLAITRLFELPEPR